MFNKAINSAIECVGSQQKLAEACGVKQPSVWAWLHGKKKVSAENAKRIEMATNGNVPAYMIRPDLTDLFPHPTQAA
jgi:DNA-binding transcriptional regulator YdaS (Cro superfamily)